MTIQRTYVFALLAITLVALIALVSTARTPVAHAQTGSTSGHLGLIGWAWSDTIGWISMDCSNTSTCGNTAYGISIDNNGVLSGFGWSDNIGWVSANSADVSGCPIAPCAP